MNAIWRCVSALTSLANRLLALALAVAFLRDLAIARWGTEEEGSGWVDIGLAWMSAHPVVVIGVGVTLLILNLNVIQFAIYSLTNSPARAYIQSTTPGGNSRVSLAAIQRALRATAAQVPEIARPRIRVLRVGRNRYRVHIRYAVRDVQNAGSAAEHLRLVLKKRFSELVVLDPKDRVEFDLDLAGIVKVDGAVVPPERKELPPPRSDVGTDSFHGPVYPVGGDGGP